MCQEDQIKCYHYNSGYCKLVKRERGCKLYHPETNCEIINCKDKECPDRHPRPCKFGDTTCIFQVRCPYKHGKD